LVEDVTATRWIQLDGAVNTRELGGLPTEDGRLVKPRRLIRSDNLQDLTPADVRHLVEDLDVRAVADLRTEVEVKSEGPGPLTTDPRVDVLNLSLFPEAGVNTDVTAAEGSSGPVVLPWQTREVRTDPDGHRRGVTAVYLGYLEDRADSVVDALRAIASAEGATIVHCAAGKDRTGVVVALALAEVGVTRDAIVEDYALTAERIDAILARLSGTRTYAADLSFDDVDRHRPKAATMERMLEALDELYGGARNWLRRHGWSEEDAAALRRKLLD
jgi:protein tyrosine/serine phosphatase